MIVALIVIWIMLGFVLGVVIHSSILDNLFSFKGGITFLLCGPLMWLVVIAGALFTGFALLISYLAEAVQDWIEKEEE